MFDKIKCIVQEYQTEILGTVGFFLASVVTMLNMWFEFMNKFIAFLGALAGLMLVFYSIDVKRLERKKLMKELEKIENNPPDIKKGDPHQKK